MSFFGASETWCKRPNTFPAPANLLMRIFDSAKKTTKNSYRQSIPLLFGNKKMIRGSNSEEQANGAKPIETIEKSNFENYLHKWCAYSSGYGCSLLLSL